MIFVTRKLLVTLCLGTISGCGFNSGEHQSTDRSELRNVFGVDNREIGDAGLSPYKAIGRIDSGCTAFLVAPKLAVTAAHCIVESSTGALKKVIGNFNNNYDLQKKPRNTARIINAWVGSYNPEDFRTKDWAILELAKPLGDDLGYLSISAVDFSTQPMPFAVAAAGYQMGFEDGIKPGVDKDCSVRSIDDKGRLLNDCDSGSGISGGPLFGGSLSATPDNTRVVALAVSEFRSNATATVRRDTYEDSYANAAIPLTDLSISLNEVTTGQTTGSTRGNTSNAFHLAITDSQPATTQKNFIQLYASANWSGGTFRDDLGQIRCSSLNDDCNGNYEVNSRVVLTAPSTIVSFRQRGIFQYWICSDARENFPGTNVCSQNGRACTVVMRSNLICSAWYQ